MRIQWYPGHMAKTKRMLTEHLALTDMVIELLDARIPYSSKNPDIDRLAANKRRVVVLNKADLAASECNTQWKKYYEANGWGVLVTDARDKTAVMRLTDIMRALTRERDEQQKQRGRIHTTIRAMIVGIPNVGKSTFINQLAGRAAAVTGDRPGVTRGKQWIKLGNTFELLDTPGVLWPKFEDESVGIRLAATGAIADDILDTVTLCEALLPLLMVVKQNAVSVRYRLTDLNDKNPRAILEMIGNARGFKMKGGTIDIERAAITVLDEFRAGKLGRITLEKPPYTPPQDAEDPSQS